MPQCVDAEAQTGWSELPSGLYGRNPKCLSETQWIRLGHTGNHFKKD